jgi:hypothetical protein
MAPQVLMGAMPAAEADPVESGPAATRMRRARHSGASYDWTCGNAWGVVESAPSLNRWKTSLVARKFDDEARCPQLEVVDPAPGVSWASGTTQSVRRLHQHHQRQH